MKKYLIIIMCALVSCVGQKEDPDEPGTSGSGADQATGIVMDFTATWCVNCPRMTTAIEEAAAEMAFIPICEHFQDEMMCDDGKELIKHFDVEAYPSAVMNMDASTLTTATSKNLILARLKASASSKAPCQLDVFYQADGTVYVNVTPAEAGEYTLFVALLEDGVVSAQTGASEDYVHNAVFRHFLQERPLGEPLGMLEKDVPVMRFYSSDGKTENHRVVAFVCHDGVVNSAKSARYQSNSLTLSTTLRRRDGW